MSRGIDSGSVALARAGNCLQVLSPSSSTTPTLEELRAVPHLSVNSIRTWVDCPRKWWLTYRERVPRAFRAIALVLGIAIHRAVGYVLTEWGAQRRIRRKAVLDILHETLGAEIHSDGPPVLLEDSEAENDVHEQADGMLVALLEVLPRPKRLIGVEVPFRLELVDESGRFLELPLVGAIDIVTVEAGNIVYTELKTAKRRWSDDQLAFDRQLTAYGMALRERGFDRPVPRLLAVTKTKVPAVQMESPHRGPEDERDLVVTAASMLRGIKAGVDHPIRSWACKTCAVAGACK